MNRKFIIAGVVLIALLAGFNVARAVHRLTTHHAPPAATATTGPRPPVYSPQTSSPAATDPFTWPSHGSASPDALVAVSGWLRGVFDGNLYSPPVYEDLVANNPPKGTVISGPATVTKSGPTEQEIAVPTNRGRLLVTMDVVDGDWLCTGLSWA